MTTELNDIRAGDIVCFGPDDPSERPVLRVVAEGAVVPWGSGTKTVNLKQLRNPPFNVGDKVRFRLIPEPTIQTVEHVHGSATVFLVGQHGQVSTHVLALVERAPKVQIDGPDTVANVETEHTLSDIRVGDIMLWRTSNGSVEVVIRRRGNRGVWDVTSDIATHHNVFANELSNPEFRVGDKVRWRGFDYQILTWGVPGQAYMKSHKYALVERAPVARKEKPMSTTLEDIRVGDIMLCPGAMEATVTQIGSDAGSAWFGDATCYDTASLRNPPFRVGDTVRHRKTGRTYVWPKNAPFNPDVYALVERAPVAAAASTPPGLPIDPPTNAGQAAAREMLQNREKLAGAWRDEGSALRRVSDGTLALTLATIERTPSLDYRAGAMGKSGSLFQSVPAAKKWCDEQLRAAGWVLEDAPLKKPERRAGPWECVRDGVMRRLSTPNNRELVRITRDGVLWLVELAGVQDSWANKETAQTRADAWLVENGWVLDGQPAVANRCTLCGHATPRHYASCEHNPEPKGTLISTLGWDQPAPVVVFCQNDEDVP